MAVLAVSREFMSGAEEIGRAVADKLGYDYVNGRRLVADIEGTGQRWARAEKDLDETPPSLWERFDREYRALISLVESLVYDYALKDRVVIMGRGANVLLEGIDSVLKVRIIAPLAQRVERLASRDHMDNQSAQWLVAKVDKARADYIRSNYGKLWDDARRFDMVINMGTQSEEQAKEMMVQALLERDRATLPASRKTLEERALAARIKAGVLTHPGLSVPTLEVKHTGDMVILKGVIHTAREHHLIEDLAKEVAGTVPVKCELHYRG